MEAKKLYALEDTYMRMPGLYALWTTLFITNLAVLGVDGTTGPSRDFNLYTNLLSTLYCGASSYNTIYGNGKPSTMLMVVGPVHQYCFWLLLAFYQGDVYGSHELGVLNAVCTGIVGLFSLDMVAKTWLLAVNPKKYLDYAKETI